MRGVADCLLGEPATAHEGPRLPRRTRASRILRYGKQWPGTGHSLKFVRPAVLEPNSRPGHKIAHSVGDEHLSRARDGHHTRPDVHRDAPDLLPDHFAFARVEPGPHRDAQ